MCLSITFSRSSQPRLRIYSKHGPVRLENGGAEVLFLLLRLRRYFDTECLLECRREGKRNG